MLIEEVLTEFKRTHLEHIEDIILTDGHEGGKAVIEYFKGLLFTLKGTSSESVNVTVKWDGAPAIVCGKNPDNGKFFVGTKAVFNKNNVKINYTKQDIARNHGTDDLGDKLLKCLVHLQKLNMDGVYQGDMMFTNDTLIRKNIDNKPHITFTPQQLTYAVPEDSELGKVMGSAKLGIIFHTTYVGETFADMSAKGGADVSGFSRNPDVWFDNAVYKDVSGSAKFTAQETQKFMAGIDKLEDLLTNVPVNLGATLGTQGDFIKYYQMFINAKVKEGELPNNVNQFLSQFQQFYLDRMEKEIVGLKTDKSIQLRRTKIAGMKQFMSKAKRPLQAMMIFYKAVQAMKAFTLNKLNQAMEIGSFQQTENGLEVTEPEGYVAVDKTGNAVKLVDRLGFSRRNLTAIKTFGR